MTTHALIPSFSLPGTSVGTQETDQFLCDRAAGLSQAKAGKYFIDKGMSKKYPAFLEKKIKRDILRMKALLPGLGDPTSSGVDYLRSLIKPVNKEKVYGVISPVNCICLANSVNAVFCNRISILIFAKRKPGIISSLNHGTKRDVSCKLDYI